MIAFARLSVKYSISLKIDDTSTEIVKFFGDTGGSATGHVEFNSTTTDIDFHVDSDEQADLVLVDAGTNDLTLTRNLAAGATTDGPILVVTNTSATGDVGVASFLNAAAASATNAAVLIQSSAAGVVKSSLFVNHDGTAGATTESAVRIDSEDTNAAALYITSAVDASGTTQEIDDYALTVVTEGVGGGIMAYRNVSAATEALMTLEDDHVDSTSPVLVITSDQDASADDAQVQLISTAATLDTTLLSVVNAGVGRAAFFDQNITSGTTLVPAVEIDSQATNGAALIVRAPTTLTGTDGDFDDFVMGISAEGVGGALHLHRDVDNPTGPLLKITEDNVMTTSSIPLLDIESDTDASASTAVVKIVTTSTANDQALMLLTQAGVTSTNFAKMITFNTFTLWVSDGTTAEGALTGVEGDICLNGGTGAGQTAFCDANGTNWTDM